MLWPQPYIPSIREQILFSERLLSLPTSPRPLLCSKTPLLLWPLTVQTYYFNTMTIRLYAFRLHTHHASFLCALANLASFQFL